MASQFTPVKPEWWHQELDASQLSSLFGFQIISGKAESFDHHGGTVGDLFKLSLETVEGPCTYVVKFLPTEKLGMSLFLGLTREAAFFNWFKGTAFESKLGSAVVGCPFATSMEETGEKLCVMEDLSGSKEGRWLMLRGHPVVEQDDVANLSAGAPSILECVTSSFKVVARIHAAFWCDQDIQTAEWVKGTAWLRGEKRDLWEAEQGMVKGAWVACKKSIDDGTAKFHWDEKAVAAIDASMAKIDWESMQRQLKEDALTLCHGDFWPCNVLFRPNGEPVLIDWELVRICSGTLDLAQFMMNLDVDFRREHEAALLRLYVDEFNNQGVVQITYEETHQGYIRNGMAKLLFLTPVLTNMDGRDKTGQFFYNQLVAWLQDFGYTEENVPAPKL